MARNGSRSPTPRPLNGTALDTLHSVRRLIVNADDFGLTPGVNSAILELNRAAALTSATLMATASECPAAAAGALKQPSLGVGCHVVLVDGEPALPPEGIPTLIAGRSGAFRLTLGSFVKDLYVNRIRESDIEAEATAQIRRIQAMGIDVTHVDTHKHTHMFMPVLRPLLRAAVACGVRAIRNPFEPQWSLSTTAGAGIIRSLQVRALRTQRRQFVAATRKAGLAMTDGAIGVLATGTLDIHALRRLLIALPRGTWELCCHPGYQDDALATVRTRLRRSREVEREALLEAIPEARGIELIHFGQLGKQA